MLKVTSPSVWISRIMISWGIGSSLFRAHRLTEWEQRLTPSLPWIVMACMAAVHVSLFGRICCCPSANTSRIPQNYGGVLACRIRENFLVLFLDET